MMGQIQIKKEIGYRLKQARKAAGYVTRREFCTKHQLPFGRYKQHEMGQRAIRASEAVKYCKILNVSLNWLMLGEQKEAAAN